VPQTLNRFSFVEQLSRKVGSGPHLGSESLINPTVDNAVAIASLVWTHHTRNISEILFCCHGDTDSVCAAQES
jgi:hypothetical protein